MTYVSVSRRYLLHYGLENLHITYNIKEESTNVDIKKISGVPPPKLAERQSSSVLATVLCVYP